MAAASASAMGTLQRVRPRHKQPRACTADAQEHAAVTQPFGSFGSVRPPECGPPERARVLTISSVASVAASCCATRPSGGAGSAAGLADKEKSVCPIYILRCLRVGACSWLVGWMGARGSFLSLELGGCGQRDLHCARDHACAWLVRLCAAIQPPCPGLRVVAWPVPLCRRSGAAAGIPRLPHPCKPTYA